MDKKCFKIALAVAAITACICLAAFAAQANAGSYVLCARNGNPDVKQVFENSCPIGWYFIRYV